MNQTHPNQNCRDSDPWMALDPNDRVHFAYLEYDPSGGSSPPCNSGLDVSNTTNGQDWGGVHYIQGFGGLVDKDSIMFDSSGRLYATWDEGNILALTWSDDDGNHWAPIENSGNVGFGVLGALVGTFGASSVYLTWWDFSTDNIMFEASHDRGQTWGPQIRVNSAGGSAQRVGPWQIPIPAMNVDPNYGGLRLRGPTFGMGTRTSSSRIPRMAARPGGRTTRSTMTRVRHRNGWSTLRLTARGKSTLHGKMVGPERGTSSTRTRRTTVKRGRQMSASRLKTRPSRTIGRETTSRSRPGPMITSM